MEYKSFALTWDLTLIFPFARHLIQLGYILPFFRVGEKGSLKSVTAELVDLRRVQVQRRLHSIEYVPDISIHICGIIRIERHPHVLLHHLLNDMFIHATVATLVGERTNSKSYVSAIDLTNEPGILDGVHPVIDPRHLQYLQRLPGMRNRGRWNLGVVHGLPPRKIWSEGNFRFERNSKIASETTPRAAGLIGQIRSDPTMLRAVRYALDLLSAFKEETGHDPGLHRSGSLMLALSDERMRSYEEQVAKACSEGIEANFLTDTEIRKLAPSINLTLLKGGYFVPGDGYLDPSICAQAYAAAATDLGVNIVSNARVTDILTVGDEVQGVEIQGKRFDASRVVVTAGPWSALLAKECGCTLPVQPIRHQRVVTRPSKTIPEHFPVVRVN